MTRRAFTLIELLVVIAIVAVLAGLAFPVYQRVMQSGRSSACLSNLRQLGVALNLYLGEHDMKMPELEAGRRDKSEDVPVIDNTLNTYVKDARVFACPADARFAVNTGTSYYWNVALNGQPLASLNLLNIIQDHSRILILADKEGFHPYIENKVNVLYADGHATKDLRFFTGN
jgi:prepilin-type N-terminal cleavage/methylation domain-containing protein/prepilin-type processing-associated H-X9-DG protein